MNPEKITGSIEEQDWLEPIAEGLQNAVSSAYSAGGPAGQKVANFLHGVWLGHPLHPVLTDVPLGAWTVAAVLDAAEAMGGRTELGPGSDAAVGIGLMGALGAAATGLTDWHPLEGRPARRVGVTHALLNVSATALYATSYFLRRGGNRSAGRTLAWLGYAVAGASAWLGGSLVYEQRIGVDHAQREPLPDDFVPVLPDTELSENQPRRVEVNGVKVVLVRQGGQIHALGEVCSHLGGPLAEGTVEDECIVCPWHGSRFTLDGGEVVDGPATFPQPAYETRVRDGNIEIRSVTDRKSG